ncbi:hypothetical protein DRQ09_08365, partial [candidate division KSB1 bacterium]
MKKNSFLFLFVLLIFVFSYYTGAGAEVKLRDIRYSFKGIKTRIVFEFDLKVNYEVVEDWIGRLIKIKFSGVDLSEFKKGFKIPVKNHIVNRIKIANNKDDFVDVTIYTNKNFTSKKLELQNPFRVVFDISILPLKVNANFYYNRGVIYELRGEYEKAIDQLEEALKISPDFQKARFMLGKIYFKKRNYEEAKRYLSEINKDSYEGKLAEDILIKIENENGKLNKN